VIGLSVDPVTDHQRWLGDIKDVMGAPVNWKQGEDVICEIDQLPAARPG
jgi:alkyl hydroperoxide reductase subunit AhpC